MRIGSPTMGEWSWDLWCPNKTAHFVISLLFPKTAHISA